MGLLYVQLDKNCITFFISSMASVNEYVERFGQEMAKKEC